MKLIKEFEPLPCSECGQIKMKKSKTGCTLSDGTVVPNLEYFHCYSCHARFYDGARMARIERKRSLIEIDLLA